MEHMVNLREVRVWQSNTDSVFVKNSQFKICQDHMDITRYLPHVTGTRKAAFQLNSWREREDRFSKVGPDRQSRTTDKSQGGLNRLGLILSTPKKGVAQEKHHR